MRNKLFMRITALLLAVVFVFLLPVRVYAMSGGLVAAEIVKASTVSCNPYVIGAACLIALGVFAVAESGAFENLNRNLTNWMLSQNFTNSRGEFDVLQTVNVLGEKTFYVAGEMLESVRGWLFESGTVSVTGLSADVVATMPASFLEAYQKALTHPYHFIAFGANNRWACGYSDTSSFVYELSASGNSYVVRTASGVQFTYFSSEKNFWKSGVASVGSNYYTWTTPVSSDLSVTVADLGLALGNVPSFYIDGTSALEWAPEFAGRQLRVINTGGGGNPDGSHDPDGPVSPHWKWYTALSLGAFAWLCTQTQQDQWTGVTPEEFPEYPTIQELEILDRPDIDGFPGIEVQPVGNPDVDPDGGEGTDPDDGDEDDPDEGTDPGDKPGPGINPDPGTNPDPDPNPEPDPDPSPEPDPNPEPDPDPSPEPDPDPSPDPDPNPDSSPGRFSLDLTDFFPFCIPFDLYDMLKAFDADPVAPKFELELDFGTLGSYPFVVDFSRWDRAAQICRRFEFIVFCIGLAVGTKKLLGW